MKDKGWNDLKETLIIIVAISGMPFFLLLSLYFWFTYERFGYFGMLLGFMATFGYIIIGFSIIIYMDKRRSKNIVVSTLED